MCICVQCVAVDGRSGSKETRWWWLDFKQVLQLRKSCSWRCAHGASSLPDDKGEEQQSCDTRGYLRIRSCRFSLQFFFKKTRWKCQQNILVLFFLFFFFYCAQHDRSVPSCITTQSHHLRLRMRKLRGWVYGGKGEMRDRDSAKVESWEMN